MLHIRNNRKYLILCLFVVLSILIWLNLYVLSRPDPYVDNELQVLTEKQTIKVINFNTQKGSPAGLCKEKDRMVSAKKAKIEALSNYIISQKADVMLLQEIVLNCDMHEADMLYEALKAKGYPMDFVTIPQEVHKTHLPVAIFSKFKMNKNLVKYIPIDGRMVLKVPIETPLGTINFYSAHIRAADPDRCPGFEKLYNEFKTDNISDGFKILGADFNLTLNDESKYTCPENIRKAFNDEFTLAGGGIDFVVIPKSSLLKIDNFWGDPNHPDSDHTPIITIISSTKVIPTPIVTPIPTLLPSPTISPSPTVWIGPTPIPSQFNIVIDFDENGNIGIEDFLVFVQYYKASNCMIDYNRNNNCKDIEDFQIFVTEYRNRLVNN